MVVKSPNLPIKDSSRNNIQMMDLYYLLGAVAYTFGILFIYICIFFLYFLAAVQCFLNEKNQS